MTGYQSKKAAAQDKLKCQCSMTTKLVGSGCQYCNPEYMDDNAFNDWWDSDYDDSTNPYEKDTFAYWAWARWQALAQPAQEPASVTYKEVQDSMNALEKGDLRQQVIAEELGQRKLYTAPPQRPWVEPTGNEWFEWWRVSPVADETEAEIDFADFLIIAQAVVAKLKELNNG